MPTTQNFLGAPYPITANVKGLFHSQSALDQIKSDLLILLLTNPGERIMNSLFGTPLRTLVFEPNDSTLQQKAKDMISQSIRMWEPRINVADIQVSNSVDPSVLDSKDNGTELEHILYIQISFFDPQNIQSVQQLVLQFPIGNNNA